MSDKRSHLEADQDIEVIEPTKKKYTGRCRLFVGNLPLEMKEPELRKIFEEFGEVAECFSSGKGFAFIRMDTRAHAEAAKEALDGQVKVGTRPMRIRFAVHGAAVRIKELSPYVSNELLYKAFSQFGSVERAVHIVDEKGRPTGEGIVEFERKPGALEALRRITEGVFLMTSNPKPIKVEPLDPRDEDDGQPERMIPKNQQMMRELEQSPRFALPGTFEHEFGNRWKELFQMEKMRKEQLDQELRESRERLEGDMDVAFQDYQAMLIREDLRRRQAELERLEAAKNEKMELMRRRNEERASARQQSFQPPGGMPGFGGGHHPFPPPNQFGEGQRHNPFSDGPFSDGFQGGGGPDRNGQGEAQGGNGQPGDDNLVHGVQKLLQMFKGGVPPDIAQQLAASGQLGPLLGGGAPGGEPGGGPQQMPGQGLPPEIWQQMQNPQGGPPGGADMFGPGPGGNEPRPLFENAPPDFGGGEDFRGGHGGHDFKKRRRF